MCASERAVKYSMDCCKCIACWTLDAVYGAEQSQATQKEPIQYKSGDNPLPIRMYVSRSVKIRATSATQKKLVHAYQAHTVNADSAVNRERANTRTGNNTLTHTHRLSNVSFCSMHFFLVFRDFFSAVFRSDIKLNLMKPI